MTVHSYCPQLQIKFSWLFAREPSYISVPIHTHLLQVAAWSCPGWGLHAHPAISRAARAAWPVRLGQVPQTHRGTTHPGLSPGCPVSTALALHFQQRLHPLLLLPLVADDIFNSSCLLSSTPGSGEQRSARPSPDQRDSEWCYHLLLRSLVSLPLLLTAAGSPH